MDRSSGCNEPPPRYVILNGPPGPTGPRGGEGPCGPPGWTGVGWTGPTGYTGPTGLPGSTIIMSKGRPDRPPPNAGSNVYIDAETGDVYYSINGNWTLMMNIKGPTGATGWTGWTGGLGFTGPQGVQGNVGYTGCIGATGPQGPQGNAGANASVIAGSGPPLFTPPSVGGALYIDRTSMDVYTHTSGSMWNQVGNILGNTGPTGWTGWTGHAGTMGWTGWTGYTGYTGYSYYPIPGPCPGGVCPPIPPGPPYPPYPPCPPVLTGYKIYGSSLTSDKVVAPNQSEDLSTISFTPSASGVAAIYISSRGDYTWAGPTLQNPQLTVAATLSTGVTTVRNFNDIVDSFGAIGNTYTWTDNRLFHVNVTAGTLYTLRTVLIAPIEMTVRIQAASNPNHNHDISVTAP